MPVDPPSGTQNELLQLVIETSPTGIVIADSQGNIASVNPQAASWLVLASQIREALEDVQRHYEDVKSYVAPIVLTLRELNLLTLCEEAFDELASLHSAFDHRLKVNENHAAVARVDSYRMKQLFRNVLENSVAASPDGSEVVASVNSTKLEGEPAVQVRIGDNGEGAYIGNTAETILDHLKCSVLAVKPYRFKTSIRVEKSSANLSLLWT